MSMRAIRKCVKFCVEDYTLKEYYEIMDEAFSPTHADFFTEMHL